MKSLKLLCAAFLLSANIFAQFSEPPFPILENTKFNVLDSANVKVSYKLTYLLGNQFNDKKSSVTDMETLLIGNNISKYYSQQLHDYSEDIISKGAKVREEIPGTTSVPDGTKSFEIFKDLTKDKLTYTEIKTVILKNFKYEEDIPQINWQVENETQEIASYKCNKATGEYAGRTYTAWYSPEIPISNGPWKFGGLPGLILKISDENNEYDFECVGIETLKEKEPIIMYDLKYDTMKKQDYHKLLKKYHTNYIPYIRALGATVNFYDGGNPDVRSQPYNPIELD